MSRPQKHLPPLLPHRPKGAACSLCQRSGPHGQPCPLSHRKHKGAHGDSYQRGLGGAHPRLPREAPSKLRRGSRASAHAGHRRRQSVSAAPGSAPAVGGGAAATSTAGAVTHALSTAGPSPQRVCQPQLLQDSSLRSGKARVPHASTLTPGTWVAGT